MHAQLGIDHGHRVAGRAHLAGAHRVVLRVGAAADVGRDGGFVVLVHRVEHLAANGVKGLGLDDGLLHLNAFDQQVQVALVAQKVRVDQRRGAHIGAGQFDAAPAVRADHIDVARKAVAQVHLAAVVVHDADHKHQLQVGRFHLG